MFWVDFHFARLFMRFFKARLNFSWGKVSHSRSQVFESLLWLPHSTSTYYHIWKAFSFHLSIFCPLCIRLMAYDLTLTNLEPLCVFWETYPATHHLPQLYLFFVLTSCLYLCPTQVNLPPTILILWSPNMFNIRWKCTNDDSDLFGPPSFFSLFLMSLKSPNTTLGLFMKRPATYWLIVACHCPHLNYFTGFLYRYIRQ